jgi:hypothetical protein
MNELQRQAYLSALGIENYAPRWFLPSAPVSVACSMPIQLIPTESVVISSAIVVSAVTENLPENKNASPNRLNTIADLGEQKKAPLAVNAAMILRQLEEKKSTCCTTFFAQCLSPSTRIFNY